MKNIDKNPALVKAVKAAAERDPKIHAPAQDAITKALQLPLRKGLFSGDVLFDIYEQVDVDGLSTPEFPLDFVEPGTECDYIAYTVPNCGCVPYSCVEGDYVRVPTYNVANNIDTCMKYLRHAGWNVLERMFEAYRAGFVKKMNNDGWHILLAAGVDRNIIVADNEAQQGHFTKRLLSLMQTVARRNGGGNSQTTGRSQLTDLFMSPEAMMDIRNWNVDQIDEITRREIFENNGMLTRLYGTNLHVLDELGQGQEYQNFVESDLGVTLPTTGSDSHTDVELVVGLDLSKRNSFIMPVSLPLETFRDETLHRCQKFGIYGWMELGFACLDSRNVLLGTF